ncbi:MAG: ABC transporter permease [Acidobacteria bacterium]|nr:MAG: ABC transporter permease [Acidobacteriota bacterium]
MAPVFALIRRDLLRWWRNPGRLAFLLALPLVLSAIFALAFGTGERTPHVRVLLLDEDRTPLSRMLAGALAAGGEDNPLEVDPVGPEGRAEIEQGRASALVVIPAGFTDAFLAGRPARLEVVKNPAERFLPGVVEDLARAGAAILSEISRAFRPELERLREMMSGRRDSGPAAVGALAAMIAEKMDRIGVYLFPPVIDVETVAPGGEGDQAPTVQRVLELVLPGLAVLSLLFFAQAVTRDVMEERERGLLRHLMCAPLGLRHYLVAKASAAVLVGAAGLAALVGLGWLVGVAWGPPGAVALLVVSSATAAAGLLLLLVALCRSAAAANAVTTMVVMLSAMVGGSFLPVTALPDFLLPISRLTVNYWAASGFLALIQGGGATEVLPNVLVLGIGGLAAISAGTLVLGRRIRAGGV